jgi:enterobactin synthetase component D
MRGLERIGVHQRTLPVRARRGIRTTSIERRALEHDVGRRCATAALREAGYGGAVSVGTTAEGGPAWPPGFVGSITHVTRFAWAAVARASLLRGIGIDAEPLFDDGAMVAAAPTEGEARTVRWLGERAGATLVFSAKEALFKCLHPLTACWFGLDDAELESVEASGTFGVRLLRDLSDEVRAGSLFAGSFRLDRSVVRTAIALQV